MWLIFLRRMFRKTLLGLVILPAIGWQVPAETGYDDLSTSEGWAWAQIKQGQEADFNSRCRTEALETRRDEETRWENDCRRLSAAFLVDILTKVPWRNEVPSSGVHIIGARIVRRHQFAERTTGSQALYRSKPHRKRHQTRSSADRQ